MKLLFVLRISLLSSSPCLFQMHSKIGCGGLFLLRWIPVMQNVQFAFGKSIEISKARKKKKILVSTQRWESPLQTAFCKWQNPKGREAYFLSSTISFLNVLVLGMVQKGVPVAPWAETRLFTSHDIESFWRMSLLSSVLGWIFSFQLISEFSGQSLCSPWFA